MLLLLLRKYRRHQRTILHLPIRRPHTARYPRTRPIIRLRRANIPPLTLPLLLQPFLQLQAPLPLFLFEIPIMCFT